jgi:hypothetical protein
VKYRCSYSKPFGDNLVVNVEYDPEPQENRHSPHVVQVWVRNGKAKCCRCSGPLTAMSGTCEHARAAKRFVAAPTP